MEKIMTTRMTFHCTAIAFCLFTASALANDWVDIKNSEELAALYSNKTFKGSGWTAHFRADGKGVLLSQGNRIPRTWKVSGNDQVCVTPENGPTNCFRFQQNRKDRSQVVITNVKESFSLMATVEDGVPQF
jgi:hypothetical protein